jgi:hypothetical protein
MDLRRRSKNRVVEAMARIVALLPGQFLARLVESLWPQISVSKVAVCYVSTAPDFERPLGVRTSTP